MHTTRLAMVVGGALFAAASAAGAQGRGNNGVPPGQMPSAGMCRIWIDGVPPGRQPAQTDCDTARRNVPANGRILYGPSVGTTTTAQGDPRRGNGNGNDQSGNVDPRRSGTWGRVGTNDPRRSGNGRYDGRYDGRNRSEDRDDDDDRDDRRRDHRDARYDNRAAERARIAREQERQDRLRQRAEQARIERERKLAWERERDAQRERERLAREERRRDRDRDRDREHDRGQSVQSGARVYPNQQPAGRPVRTVFGTVQAGAPAGCVDANRDGVCDTQDPRKRP